MYILITFIFIILTLLAKIISLNDNLLYKVNLEKIIEFCGINNDYIYMKIITYFILCLVYSKY